MFSTRSCGLFAPGENLAKYSCSSADLAVPCSLPSPNPPAKNIDAGHPGLRMVFGLWCEEGGMYHLVCKACRGSGIRLVSEGRNLGAVTEKTILKIESENLRRSLSCHSYSSGLQKHLKSSNKHDIKIKTGLPGF